MGPQGGGAEILFAQFESQDSNTHLRSCSSINLQFGHGLQQRKGTILFFSKWAKAHVQTGAEPCHEFIGSACKGEIWQWCSPHFVPHFAECSWDVIVSCEFVFGALHGTFLIVTVTIACLKV
jgi:hypothetical protein